MTCSALRHCCCNASPSLRRCWGKAEHLSGDRGTGILVCPSSPSPRTTITLNGYPVRGSAKIDGTPSHGPVESKAGCL